MTVPGNSVSRGLGPAASGRPPLGSVLRPERSAGRSIFRAVGPTHLIGFGGQSVHTTDKPVCCIPSHSPGGEGGCGAMAFPLTGNASRRMNIFSCGVDFHGECAVAYLRGELDSCTVEHLVDRLCPLAMAGQDIVGDLSRLQFVATAGLTALDELERHASAAGGAIRLTDQPPPMPRDGGGSRVGGLVTP